MTSHVDGYDTPSIDPSTGKVRTTLFFADGSEQEVEIDQGIAEDLALEILRSRLDFLGGDGR